MTINLTKISQKMIKGKTKSYHFKKYHIRQKKVTNNKMNKK